MKHLGQENRTTIRYLSAVYVQLSRPLHVSYYTEGNLPTIEKTQKIENWLENMYTINCHIQVHVKKYLSCLFFGRVGY